MKWIRNKQPVDFISEEELLDDYLKKYNFWIWFSLFWASPETRREYGVDEKE